MACFIVTHQVTPQFSPDDLIATEKRVIGHLPREIKWVMSWHLPEQNIVLAHWDAPTAQAVRVALERSGLGAALPLIKIEPAVELYPKRYVARRAQPRRARLPVHKRGARKWSGAYAEAATATLQTRATFAHPVKTR